jgi:NADPH:quinone reductase-like Zn-dependent oxidoreductase
LNSSGDPATQIGEVFLKAVQIYRHGGIEQLCFDESSEPTLKSPYDAIVRLKAAALNQVDLRVRRGETSALLSFPHILGCDGSGVVVERGAAVNDIQIGASVCLFPALGCGTCESCTTDNETLCAHFHTLGERANGTYAQFVRVPSRNCFPIPVGLSFEEAAAFPLAFATAWRMLHVTAKLRPGEWVLIRGIGGGVATAAFTLALHFGAHVIVTSRSDEKLTRALELGAMHGLCENAEVAVAIRKFTAKRGVDVVIDCIGGASWSSSLAALARGGRLLTCVATTACQPQTNLQRIFWNHLKIFGSSLSSRQEFRQLLKFIETARVKPVLDKIFPLADAARAQHRLEAGKQFGKIVLQVTS